MTLRHARTGLVNGNGFVNGQRGLTNGNGLTNGFKGKSWDLGITNGLSHSNGISRPDGSRKKFAKIVAVAGIVLLVFVALSPALLNVVFPPSNAIEIDGDFSDWQGKNKLSDSRSDSPRDGTNIVEYSVASNDDQLCYYIKTEKNIMSDIPQDGVAAFFIFIDRDGNSKTGYQIGGLGADYKAELVGWNKNINSATVLAWDSDRPTMDWNGFKSVGCANFATLDHELEVGISKSLLGLGDVKTAKAVIVGYPDNGVVVKPDFSDTPISVSGIAVKAVVEYPASATIDASKDSVVMVVRMSALGGDATVSGIRLQKTGNAVAQDIAQVAVNQDNGNGILDASDGLLGTAQMADSMQVNFGSAITIKEDATATLLISAKANSASAAGATFGVKLEGASDIISDSAIGIDSKPNKNYYVASTTKAIVIDGAFEDWANIEKRQDTRDGSANPNTDLKSYAAANDSSTMSLYMKVGDEILGGASIPTIKLERPSTTGGPGGPGGEEPVQIDRDFALYYIDSDKNKDTGYCPYGFPIGAEYLIKIEGTRGMIISSALYKHTGSKDAYAWAKVANVSSACAGSELEAQIALASVGTNATRGALIFVQINGWKNEQSFYTNVPIGLGFSNQTKMHAEGSRSVPVIDTGTPDYVEAPFGTIDNSVKVSNLVEQGCVISWITDVPASTSVAVYDSTYTPILGSPFTVNTFSDPSTQHYVQITSNTILSAAGGTTFYFRVTSTNADGSDTAPSSGYYSFVKPAASGLPCGYVIWGMVLDSGGNPVQGAIIIAKDYTKNSPYISMVTDSDGVWYFDVYMFRDSNGNLVNPVPGGLVGDTMVVEAWCDGSGNATTGTHIFQGDDPSSAEQFTDMTLSPEPLGVPEYDALVVPMLAIAMVTCIIIRRRKKETSR